jgi:hypothetical protein
VEVLKTLCVIVPVTFWSVIYIFVVAPADCPINRLINPENPCYQDTWQYSRPREGFKPRKTPAFWLSGIWCVLVHAATVIRQVILHSIYLLLEPYKHWAFMSLWKQAVTQ